jgi:hypothetical protein
MIREMNLHCHPVVDTLLLSRKMARYQLTFRGRAWCASESIPTNLSGLLRTPSCTNLYRQAHH